MKANDYTARIINANPLELVIITYELIDGHLKSALGKNELEAMKHDILKARQFLSELVASLDIEYDISKELMSIYIYANKLLVESELKISLEKLEQAKEKISEAVEILDKLGEGWRTIKRTADPDESDKPMKNTQHLYAGLTYKDGKLTEFVDDDGNRGFKA